MVTPVGPLHHPRPMVCVGGILGPMVPDPVLDRLEASFERRRARMLRTHEGKWALMIYRRVSEPTEFFDTQREATSAGFHKAAGGRFLVKQVLKEDRVIQMPYRVVVADHR